MNLKRHFGEALTLVVAAILCALVANALARSERKLPLVGSYPNATTLPEKTGGSYAPSQSGMPLSSPGSSEAAAASEVSSKVNGGLEKRPRPAMKSASAAPAPAPAGEQKESLLSRFPPHPDKPYVEVTGNDAAWLVAHGVLVVDARRTKDYEAGHVASAQNISPWEGDADAKITSVVNEGRDVAQPVLVYCSGGDCEDSHMLAERLFGVGFNNLLVYKDGWPDWVKRGGKSATGPEPSR
jgi:rhodanese-related sulfurtransferase